MAFEVVVEINFERVCRLNDYVIINGQQFKWLINGEFS